MHARMRHGRGRRKRRKRRTALRAGVGLVPFEIVPHVATLQRVVVPRVRVVVLDGPRVAEEGVEAALQRQVPHETADAPLARRVRLIAGAAQSLCERRVIHALGAHGRSANDIMRHFVAARLLEEKILEPNLAGLRRVAILSAAASRL